MQREFALVQTEDQEEEKADVHYLCCTIKEKQHPSCLKMLIAHIDSKEVNSKVAISPSIAVRNR